MMKPVISSSKYIILITGLISSFLFSCSKKSSLGIPPAPVDTLGTGWKKLAMPELSYNDIFFINNNTGYVTGDGQIFRSTDGGNNWQKVYQASGGFINIAMGSESNIVFISPGSRILFTKNGGASFDSVSINDIIQDAFFVNATTVYAVGEKFWKSVDAGSTWTKIYDFPFSSAGYRSLHFLNDQYGWVTGTGGPFKTTNGGIAWEQKPNPAFSFGSGNVFFTDVNNGYVSDGSITAKTTNGGNTWNRVFTGSSGYNDLHFISTNTGYTTDGNYVYKTLDGGSTWNKEVALPQKILVELHFTDASHGWACGTGAVLKFQN